MLYLEADLGWMLIHMKLSTGARFTAQLHSIASAVLASRYIRFRAPDLVLLKQAQVSAKFIAKEQHDLQKEAQTG